MSAAILLQDATAVSTGSRIPCKAGQFSFDCKVEGSGAVSATVVVQVTNFPEDDGSWKDSVTFTLSGTNYAVDGIALWGPWKHIRGKVTAISGTGAKVNLVAGTPAIHHS